MAEGAELDIPHCASNPQHSQAQRQELLYISEFKFQDIFGSLAKAGQQGRGPRKESLDLSKMISISTALTKSVAGLNSGHAHHKYQGSPPRDTTHLGIC